MSDAISFVRKSIEAQRNRGDVINVEAHVAFLQKALPDLSHKKAQDMILEIVVEVGGVAVWGSEQARAESAKRE